MGDQIFENIVIAAGATFTEFAQFLIGFCDMRVHGIFQPFATGILAFVPDHIHNGGME